MREEVVEFGAHLEDALWGVVGEELVGYLVDEALVVRWGDWGGVFDGFAGRCVRGGGRQGGKTRYLLLSVDSLKHQERSSEIPSALFSNADRESLVPAQLLNRRNVLHHPHHLRHSRRRNPHQQRPAADRRNNIRCAIRNQDQPQVRTIFLHGPP